jgi:hypothetical protein
VNVRIKAESISPVKRRLSRKTSQSDDALRFFLERAYLDTRGFLSFKASEDGHDPYVPDEEEGDVPALYGKWREAESIAKWLRQYSASGGRMVLHSIEGDGEAWGWEFDGRGHMRELALKPVGKWQ